MLILPNIDFAELYSTMLKALKWDYIFLLEALSNSCAMRPHEKATAVLTGILQIRLQYLHVPLYICSMYLLSFNAGSLSSTSCLSCTCWLLTGCNFKENGPTLSLFKFSLFQNKILAVLGEGSNNNILYFQSFLCWWNVKQI